MFLFIIIMKAQSEITWQRPLGEKTRIKGLGGMHIWGKTELLFCRQKNIAYIRDGEYKNTQVVLLCLQHRERRCKLTKGL